MSPEVLPELSYSPLFAASTVWSSGQTPAEPSESNRVKEAILDMIRDREIFPGQKLDQRRLAKQLDSTTAPLREALSSLEAENVLVRVHGLGVFCRAYTVRELEELIEIRRVLEGLAASRAVPHLTPESHAELLRLADELEKPIPSGEENHYSTIHLAFHNKVLELSRSTMLVSLMKQHHFIDTFIGSLVPSLWKVEPHEHHTVVEGIASGDPQKAESAMRAHIAPWLKERMEKYRQIYGVGPILPTRHGLT